MAKSRDREPPKDVDSPWLRETEQLGEPTSVPGSTSAPTEAGHYQLLEVLGRGAMGEVRKAFDPKLGRFVALKVLRNASPELAPRLMKEARAQARVEHANVCKVYGVGELDGQPFIALQYVDGGTLAAVAPSMTREQLLGIMRDVAYALHAAHKQGLVHRDIKPTNILVEKLEDGQYRPYVADFGIARELEAPGVTASGVAVGTPVYMAPEQARGHTQLIDQRTDVYGVGATLYELLSGRRPFSGANAIEVLWQVVHEDAPSLRTIDPTIPTDLETIVLKAMEKDPARRYDSARAFGEDLQRYLDGDPIASRSGRLVYRLAKRARKHRALVAASLVAVVVAVAVGGIALRARLIAAERARLQRAFGQEVERIDATARYAVLLPLHDTAPELAAIRERMAQVRAEMDARGPIAEGPGHDALGRAHLALGEYDAAVRELERAWAAGERSPEVSYALGRAHGALYQQGIASMLKADDAAVDEQHKRELVRRHRDPALRALAQVGDWKAVGVGAREYGDALIALYQGRYAEAVAHADEAAARVRWLHEAHTLKGDIHLIAGKERTWKHDFDGATRELGLAGEAYRAATLIAPSNSAAWLGECQRLSTELSIDFDRRRPFEKKVDAAAAACQKAHAARSDDPQPLAAEAWVWQLLMGFQSDRGTDTKHAFNEAVRLGEAALKLDPRHMQGLLALGIAHEWRNWDEVHGGLDPRATIARSMAYGRRALEVNPREYLALVLMSELLANKGGFEADNDLDPGESAAQAISFANRALEISPDGARAVEALGHTYMLLEYDALNHGGDATGPYRKLTELFARTIQLSPTLPAGFNNKCCAEYGYGEFQRRRGVDPTATIQQAITSCKRSAELDPRSSWPLQGMGEAYVALARWQLEHGIEAMPTVTRGLTPVRAALALSEPNAYAHHVAGDLELLAGHFPAAEVEYRRSVALNAREIDARTGLVELFRRRAEWQLAHGRPAAADIKAGLMAAAEAEKIATRYALPVAIEGALHLLTARSSTGQARKRAGLEAVRALEKALGLNANLEREYRPLLDEARRLATE